MPTKLDKETEAQSKLNNRIWRLSNLYKIKTKDRRLIYLHPNKAQLSYLEEETKRDIILKARQLGFSTLKLIEQLDFVLFNRNSSAAVIAHLREKVQTLFEIIRLAFDNLPKELKPEVSYDNRNELYFPKLNSKIYVAIDTRGETVHNLHVSELAYLENAEERMLGLLESVPKDGYISFESTANGMSGYFYETWEQQDSEFKKHFYAWNLDKEYREPTNKSMEQLISEYEPLRVLYGLMPDIWERLNLDTAQFNWYINKAKRQRKGILQEYPSSSLEAFIASGRNIFALSDIQKHQPKDPIDRKYKDLLIWEHPLQGFMYTIGVDPAEGIGQDNSVIEVLNAHTGEQVAEMAINNMAPDDLAGAVLDIAIWYNKAFIVPEINNHGLTLVDKIKMRYANIYRREIFDKISGRQTSALGWKTTGVTKPRLVDSLEEWVRNEDIKINSIEALKELKVFVKSDDVDKKGYGAEGSAKDDRVIALGLAIQGIKHLPKMKKLKSRAQIQLEEYVAKKNLEQLTPSMAVHSKMKRNYKIRGF